ncbi:hypothetical protein QBC38DRAFT_447534 [Podospora fimiseda]|uniref:Uncharacterized protein n=1 Tax=Podospora fimiseda TaxID=252190 RepID=A0AAN7BH16_9PEZI|nr:hypothetical protein QBC38DRAFT_447534 [Podospora fimiseda]
MSKEHKQPILTRAFYGDPPKPKRSAGHSKEATFFENAMKWTVESTVGPITLAKSQVLGDSIKNCESKINRSGRDIQEDKNIKDHITAVRNYYRQYKSTRGKAVANNHRESARRELEQAKGRVADLQTRRSKSEKNRSKKHHSTSDSASQASGFSGSSKSSRPGPRQHPADAPFPPMQPNHPAFAMGGMSTPAGPQNNPPSLNPGFAGNPPRPFFRSNSPPPSFPAQPQFAPEDNPPQPPFPSRYLS